MAKLITCSSCGEVKPCFAKKLCRNCYEKQRNRTNIQCKQCGETKPHQAFGLCYNCWREQRKKPSTLESRSKHAQESRNNRYKRGFCQSMSENKSCSLYLGITIAEKVLSKVFKDVEIMPNCNPGYDFICGKGYKVDVKSSCRRKEGNTYRWTFIINKNQIPDYFLLLTFDNRENLNPEHIWLIPGNIINDKKAISISESRINKWDEYKLDIDKVIECCNIIKGSD